MIHFIILAAVRKGLQDPHTREPSSLRKLLYVYRLDVMMQQHAQISCENLPAPLKLENIIIS